MSRKLTRRAALGLIGAGALGSVTWSGGFSQLRAGRTALVDTASPANAYLGLENLSGGNSTPTIFNQSGYKMEMNLSSPDSGVDFDVNANGTNDGSNPTFDIADTESVEFEVIGTGQVTVNFDAVLKSGSSTVGEISLQRTVKTQTGQNGQN